MQSIIHKERPESASMAYMIMLALEHSEQLKPVLASWQALGVDEITFVESRCAHLRAPPRAHIPIRFIFESMSGEREACTLTLFAVVADEATVHACVDATEAVIGDLDAVPTAMIAAWPLPVVKGFPKSKRGA
jgi:hypothetical protein